jgi:hypothetical protein
VLAPAVSGNTFYAGGWFTTAGGNAANSVTINNPAGNLFSGSNNNLEPFHPRRPTRHH